MSDHPRDVKELIASLLGNHKFRQSQSGAPTSVNRNLSAVLEKKTAIKSADGRHVPLPEGTEVIIYRQPNCASSEYLATIYPPGPAKLRTGHLSVYGDGTVQQRRYGAGASLSSKGRRSRQSPDDSRT